MGIEQLDLLQEQANVALALLAAGNTDEVMQIIQALVPLITEEKRKIAGDEKTWYHYECAGCSLKCKGQFKFIPDEKALLNCWLDGKKGGKFGQVDIQVES